MKTKEDLGRGTKCIVSILRRSKHNPEAFHEKFKFSGGDDEQGRNIELRSRG